MGCLREYGRATSVGGECGGVEEDGGRSLGCVSARVVAQRAKVRSEVS
jgi:hypothetical protein